MNNDDDADEAIIRALVRAFRPEIEVEFVIVYEWRPSDEDGACTALVEPTS